MCLGRIYTFSGVLVRVLCFRKWNLGIEYIRFRGKKLRDTCTFVWNWISWSWLNVELGIRKWILVRFRWRLYGGFVIFIFDRCRIFRNLRYSLIVFIFGFLSCFRFFFVIDSVVKEGRCGGDLGFSWDWGVAFRFSFWRTMVFYFSRSLSFF